MRWIWSAFRGFGRSGAEVTFPKEACMAYCISGDCIACGSCISECPSEAISEGDIYVIDASKCIDCGACADVCPSDAIAPK